MKYIVRACCLLMSYDGVGEWRLERMILAFSITLPRPWTQDWNIGTPIFLEEAPNPNPIVGLQCGRLLQEALKEAWPLSGVEMRVKVKPQTPNLKP